MERIYFDHAATTPVSAEVFEAMKPYFTDTFGNAANTVYSFGRESARAVAEAREKVARALGAEAKNIYFTSGGTEADVWAVLGVLYAKGARGKHVVVSAIEHAAVLGACAQAKRRGFEVTYVGVDSRGVVRTDELERAIRPDTALVSVMTANNEIGTIQPVAEIAKICAAKGVYFHTDAVQAAGVLDIDVKKIKADLLSVSAHKFYGPKGIGALYIGRGVKIDNLIPGGHQERGLRGGTTNVPYAVGMGAAIEAAVRDREANVKRLRALRAHFIQRLSEIPYVKFNGDPDNSLPGIVSVAFEFIESEGILTSLDLKGIAASSGSACASDSLEPSHVLLAAGMSHGDAQGVVR
jgi:cysteine desulfurase